MRRYTQAKMKLYQGFLACSEQDESMLRKHAPEVPALVIPNGVDLSTFVSTNRQETKAPTLLYVGSMYYYPNVDAVQFFFDRIYKSIRQAVPDVRVQIVGHAPPPNISKQAKLPGVEVTGSVPDVRPYLERATLFIVPLRLGGGTRLKIVEAMAMGVPVISTSVGAEGLDVQSGKNILIADDAESFTESILRLLSDRDLGMQIVEGGRLLANRYDWRDLMSPFADFAEKAARGSL